MITRKFISNTSHTINLLLLSAAALYALSFLHIGKLSKIPPSEINEELSTEPDQSSTGTPTFNFTYGGRTYVVEPVADYKITGLIVSHNNVGGITDAYHSKDSVDLKDLCVVWGQNVESGIYQKVRFWSEPWTCYFQTENRELLEAFAPDQLSNNHILGGTEAVRNTIRNMHVGDQISLRGFLVNYWDSEFPDSVRRTSLTREDTGNGACEVLFTTEARVIKAAAPGWWRIYHRSRDLALILLVIKILSFLILPYIEYRYT